MARIKDKPPVEVIVRKYGMLPPLDFDKDCTEHLFLQNKLWNRLVEIEMENRATYREVSGSVGKVAPLVADIEVLEAHISDLVAERSNLRMVLKIKKGDQLKDIDLQIAEAKVKKKDLIFAIRAAKSEEKEAIKTLTEPLETARKDAVKLAYQQSGLWWCNYNAVINSYNVARSKAMKEGADLNFHRFDGTGRFTCQIQGGMTTEQLLNGDHNIASLRLVSSGEFSEISGKRPPALWLQEVGSRKDSRQYGVLKVTVYTFADAEGKHQRRFLSIPVILHRPLPETGDLKEFTVTRKRVGATYNWNVTFTYTQPKQPSPKHDGMSCGINMGWKRVPGGLRIASIVPERGAATHIVMPQSIVDDLVYVSGLKSRVDTMTNDNFSWLKENVRDVPPELEEQYLTIKRAKSSHPVKYAKFVNTWRTQVPEFSPELLREAELRRKAAKRLMNELHHKRDKVLARRKDFYIKQAKVLAEKYSYIVIDDMDLREFAKLENDKGEYTELSDVARSMRTMACISEFREWLVKQAVKTGCIIDRKMVAQTVTCNECGHVNTRSLSVMWTCAGCGSVFDQDENAAANLLAV